MRHVYFFLVLYLGVTADSIGQFDIPNAGFENWTPGVFWTLEPDLWQTMNFQLVEHVVPDSSSFEGSRSMRVYPTDFDGTGVGIATTTFDTDAIPPYLSFAVKCQVAIGDTVGVKISFWNNELVENAIYISTWFSANDIPAWTIVNIPLNQIEPEINYAIIEVSAGNTFSPDMVSLDTWISVDAFDSQFQTHIEDIPFSECPPRFFPSPSSGVVNIDMCGHNLRKWQLFDLTGKLIRQGYDTRGLSLFDLPEGLYLGRIKTTNGREFTQRIIRN